MLKWDKYLHFHFCTFMELKKQQIRRILMKCYYSVKWFLTKKDDFTLNRIYTVKIRLLKPIFLAKSRFSSVIICTTKIYRLLNAKKLSSYCQSFRRRSEYIGDI